MYVSCVNKNLSFIAGPLLRKPNDLPLPATTVHRKITLLAAIFAPESS
jgi:hypothetical protein